MNFYDNIEISDDEEIICLTNKEGIQIYDTKNFCLKMKIDPFRIGLSEDVTKCKMSYNTQLLAFSIIETETIDSKQKILYNDSKIKRHSLVIYDLKNYEILGKITMKNLVEISDFLLTKYFIIIMIENKNKALLFKTSNLEFFKVIHDVEMGTVAYSDTYTNPPPPGKKNKTFNPPLPNRCVIAYKDYEKKQKINLIQYIFDEKGEKILANKKSEILTEFNSVGLKYIGFIASYLLVSSNVGNKVHLYDVLTGHFKYCLFLGNFPYEISGLKLDNKQKILSVITNNKYIKLYKLNKLNKQCRCASHNDLKVSMNEERGMFDKFKHKLGVGRNDFLCRFKVNIDHFDIKDNVSIVFFDKSCNDVVYVVQLNRNIKKLKFDRKKSKEMMVLQEIELSKYSDKSNRRRTMNRKSTDNEESEKQKENEEREKKKSDVKHVFDDDDLEEEEKKAAENKENSKNEEK